MMVIIEENRGQTKAVTLMPHLAAWAATYGKATAYTAVTHPSLPNYLAIAGGDDFGVADDNPPSWHPISGDSVFDQTLSLGRRAPTYAEGMTSNCMLSNTGRRQAQPVGVLQRQPLSGPTTMPTTCRSARRSAGNLLTDINAGHLPNTGMMIPDLCNDAHDCPLTTADNWLGGVGAQAHRRRRTTRRATSPSSSRSTRTTRRPATTSPSWSSILVCTARWSRAQRRTTA